MSKMYFVYLLKSLADGKYYIGQTNNTENRLKRHNDGFVSSTKNRRPLVLLGTESFDLRKQATFREYELKNNTNERLRFYKKLDKDLGE